MATSVIPTLDIAPFVAAGNDPRSSAAAVAVAKHMGAAFEATGFAVVTGTGLDPQLGRDLYQLSARFHDLPADMKARCAGYIPHGDENVSQLIGRMDAPNDISDRLGIRNSNADTQGVGTGGAALAAGSGQGASTHNGAMRIMGGNPRESALQAERGPDFVADDLIEGLQAAAQRYFDGVHAVWKTLTRMTEVALDLPLHYFDDFYPKQWSAGSMRCYPTLASESDLEDGQLRFGAHTDSGGLTLLRCDFPFIEFAFGLFLTDFVCGRFATNCDLVCAARTCQGCSV